MPVRLLSNLPVQDLTTDTDYLGIIDKGNLIRDFLIGNKDQFDEIKMFSLYGEWGSGKSSLMKYLQKELNTEFNTYFFEAWEFEKDENLAMSLLEFLTLKHIDVSDEFFSNLLKYGGRILRGLGKSVKLSAPIFPGGPEAELDMSGFIDEFRDKEDVSFYKALEKFKAEFVRLEDEITKGDKPKYNIVFIDDLDRCEPEQVLNLLSAIKLFFTYGKKTIFFCGIDKKAVEQAVKTKYGEVVKANEYLEKIFDISFSMPIYDNILPLINHYFDNAFFYEFGNNEVLPINETISSLLKYLEFNNPRRIKKVLNKFQMLRNIKSLGIYPHFPNIDGKKQEQSSYFETTLVVYLIILHEFYPEYFMNFLDFDYKRKHFSEGFKKSSFLKESVDPIGRLNEMISTNKSNQPFNEMILRNNSEISAMIICLAPSSVKELSVQSIYNSFSTDQMTVGENKIEYLFYKFVIENKLYNLIELNASQSSFNSIKKLIKDAL